MKNLIEMLKAENNKHRNEFVNSLDKCLTVESILNIWFLNQYMTENAKIKVWKYEDLKGYILKRYDQIKGKDLLDQISRISTILNSGKLVSAHISVEWKKSKMWGMNPSATMDLIYNKEGLERYSSFFSGSIGGCGYDKLCTAVANVLNQAYPILKELQIIKENNSNMSNHQLFGYGSGYGIFPNFEGGVGVSCYPKIFEKIGFEFKPIASGKTFDVFSINAKVIPLMQVQIKP